MEVKNEQMMRCFHDHDFFLFNKDLIKLMLLLVLLYSSCGDHGI